MKNLRNWTGWLGAGAVVMMLSTGCADRNKNGQPDSVATSEETSNAIKEGVDKTEQAANKAGDAIKNNADDIGAKVSEGTKKTADVVVGAGAALAQTVTIKNALGAAEALKGSVINVDTIADKKTVALRGTVKTAQQKTMAGKIAERNSDGYKVDNQLKVAP